MSISNAYAAPKSEVADIVNPDVVDRNKRPLQVTLAAALLVIDAVISLSAYAYSIRTLGAFSEVLRLPYFFLPPLLILIISPTLVALLVSRQGWSRYLLVLLCLASIPDLVPSEARAGSTLEYPLAIAVAWLSLFAQVAALFLSFLPPSSSWYASRRRENAT